MALKMVLDSIEGLGADVAKEYVQRDGKYELQVEGAKSQGDVDRVTEALRKEREDHDVAKKTLKRYGAHTPEAVTTMADEVTDLRLKLEGVGASPAKLEETISARVNQQLAAAKRPLEQKIQELDETNKTLTDRVGGYERVERTTRITSALRDQTLVEKVGLKADLMDDSYDLWSLHNFTVDAAGKVVTSDAFGTPGLPPEVAMKELRTEGKKRHLFGDTVGGGAGGAGKDLPAGGVNPFAEGTFNLTKLGAIVRDNPAQAQRLAASATTKTWNAHQYLPPELQPKG